MHNDAHLITGLILAGGQATRMQHRDKGLQLLRGRSLVQHVLDRLAPQVSTVAINANRHLDDYAQTGKPVWQDEGFNNDGDTGNDNPPQRYRGPLAGVATGLTHCSTPFLLTVPCDAPLLPTDLASRLMAALMAARADVAVACSGPIDAPQIQPVFCLIKKTLGKQIQTYLAMGGRRMDGWYGSAQVVQVHFTDETGFSNINTLAELEKCEQLLASSAGLTSPTP